MGKVFDIFIYDTLDTNYQCCCSYDNEHILIATSRNIYKYNIFTKNIIQIYQSPTYEEFYRQHTIYSIYYKNGYIFFIDEYYRGATEKQISLKRLEIETLNIKSYVITGESRSTISCYIYELDDKLTVYTSYHDSTGTSATFKYFSVIKIFTTDIEMENIDTLYQYNTIPSTYTTQCIDRPIPSILKNSSSQKYVYWYSFKYQYGDNITNYTKYGYTLASNPTSALTLDTLDNEYGDYNAFDYNDKYYILTSKYLIAIDKDSGNPQIVRDNPTNLISQHYAFVGDDVYAISENSLIKISSIDYDITYTIKNADGTYELASITNLTPLISINFEYDGDNLVCKLTTLSGVNYMYYTPSQIEGRRLVGYSLKPNSNKPDFNLNENYNLSISNNVTFYEVYTTFRPPSKAFQLTLYKNSAEPNRVDKTNYLTQLGILYGAFRDETSVTNMVINIQQEEFPQFNYVYIPIFHRYYYVTDIASIRQNLWEISLSIDVLMSYKDAIKSCYAFVDRNEFTSNPMLIDKKRVIEQGIDIEVHQVLNDVFVDYPETDIDDTQYPLADTDTFFVLNGYKIKSRHHYD